MTCPKSGDSEKTQAKLSFELIKRIQKMKPLQSLASNPILIEVSGDCHQIGQNWDFWVTKGSKHQQDTKTQNLHTRPQTIFLFDK